MLILVAIVLIFIYMNGSTLSKNLSFSPSIAQRVYLEQYANALDASLRYDIDTSIILAIICVESQGKVNAVGLSGERGLMQLTPPALMDSNSITNLSYSFDEMFDGGKNVRAGTGYLRWLLNRLHTKQLAVRAYNAGIGNIGKNPNLAQNYLDSVTKYANYISSISV